MTPLFKGLARQGWPFALLALGPKRRITQFCNKRRVGRLFFGGQACRQGLRTCARTPHFGLFTRATGLFGLSCGQDQIWLPTAHKFKIDLGQNFGIEQGAVLFAG